MNRADEKRAFEQMMAEISDSDSDGDEGKGRSTGGGPQRTRWAPPSSSSYSAPTSSSSLSIPAVAAPKVAAGGTASSSSSSSSSSYPLFGEPKGTSREEEIENFGVGARNVQPQQQASQAQTDHVHVVKRWLFRPCVPGDPPILCYVERHRTGFGALTPTTYKCFLEGTEGQGPRFLMSARKKTTSKTSYYLISMDQEPQDDRGSESVLGKVRGNAVGSQYLITDGGLAPDKAVAPSMLRKELGLVRFEFDSGGPSRIEAWVPSVSATGVATVVQPATEDDTLGALVERRECDALLSLVNKKPKWDDAHGGHVLNFQGRVTESSVKNFQLCVAEGSGIPAVGGGGGGGRGGGSGAASLFNGNVGAGASNDDVVLQFGRVAKHKFTLDVKYPLSLVQAFCIAVACMDGKIADRKGYEYLRKLAGSEPDDDGDDDGDRKGSVGGSKTLRGSIVQALPSTQYLRDKISRTFK